MRPIVLTIAGSDSSGGAGLQADLKSIEAAGGYAATVVTAITAQNTRGVRRAEPLAPDLVRAQIDAVLDDLDVAAVKTGMLATSEIVREVAAALGARPPVPLVVDPVMRSKSGDALLDPQAVSALRETLFPLATLVTPNVHEAEALTGIAVRTRDDAERAGRRLVELGARAALVKGGHLSAEPGTDVLVWRDGPVRVFRGRWIDTAHTHGTGCALASAIAARLACGSSLDAAVSEAKELLTEALARGWAVGRGQGPPDLLAVLAARGVARRS